jgi:hypothetical protein
MLINKGAKMSNKPKHTEGKCYRVGCNNVIGEYTYCSECLASLLNEKHELQNRNKELLEACKMALDNHNLNHPKCDSCLLFKKLTQAISQAEGKEV